jgi:hypothetical protein
MLHLFGKTSVYKGTEAVMTTQSKRHIHWILWPFAAIWKLLAVIVEMTGRFIAMVLGIVLIIVGVITSLTIIGAIIGVPLAIVGLLLFLRGIF